MAKPAKWPLSKDEPAWLGLGALVSWFSPALALAWFVVFPPYDAPLARFNHQYGKLQLVTSRENVEKLFGASPDFDCRLGTSTIWYYRRPDQPADAFDHLPIARGAMVQSPADLPKVHASVQIAFDANGIVWAYTMVDQVRSIETTNGPVAGSSLGVLPRSEF